MALPADTITHMMDIDFTAANRAAASPESSWMLAFDQDDLVKLQAEVSSSVRHALATGDWDELEATIHEPRSGGCAPRRTWKWLR
jgi:hypothetical protein